MSPRTAAKPKAKRLKEGESSVAWVEEDSSAARTASARVSKWARVPGDFISTEAEVKVEAFYHRKAGGITENAEAFIECSIHGVGPGTDTYVHRKVTIEGALLADLPLIALGLQGALKIGMRDGSFPDMPGVPAR